ncbi:MAG: peptidylprolyl isomerase [Muribaculaceae bacterium]
MKAKTIIALAALATVGLISVAQNNIIEEVAWIIGDEPIYKSEIEQAYQDMQNDRIPINGDPYCVIPEQIAVERLFLHQADLDTVEVTESMVMAQVDAQMNYLITNLGSREKVEQYFRKPFNDIREYYATSMRNRFRISQVRRSLTKDLKITPADVRRYYQDLPEDSIPYVPLQVQVQIVTINPVIPREEIEDVKARLRDYADRVNRGEADFSTLAILYSEAPEGIRGGEIGFMGRGQLVPEYAAVAFNLNDPTKVSRIVETEYGFHIIQLIEKRGDRINTRHILLRPKVSDADLTDAINRLDSVRTDIVENHRFTFEEAAQYISQDKDTHNSRGVMVNPETGTVNFQMSELPQEVARVVAGMEPGEISAPFIMRNSRSDREIVAIVKLTTRIPAHRANLSDDYQLIKNMCENAASERIVNEWLINKINDTYVRIEEGWRGCDFKYDGWIKSK